MNKKDYIKKIEWAHASDLQGMTIASDDSCKLPANVTFHEIDIWELVGAKVETNMENNQLTQSVTITFKTKNSQPMRMRGKVYRLTDMEGGQYLLGTWQRPYCVWKESASRPEKPTDSTLKTVTITLKSLHPLLTIIL